MFRTTVLLTPLVAAIGLLNSPNLQADAGQSLADAEHEASADNIPLMVAPILTTPAIGVLDAALMVRRHLAMAQAQAAASQRSGAKADTNTDSSAASASDGQTTAQRNRIVAQPSTAQPSTLDTEPFSSEMLLLRDKIRRVKAIYIDKSLNTRDHNPWEVMHGIVAYGVETQLFIGGPRGEPKNAITWVCWNKRCQGIPLLERRGEGINARKGPYVQGHYGQLLAILAQSRVLIDYPMRADGKTFTVADLVETEKRTCRSKTELTFKLIGLAHYLDLNETWKNESGQQWSIPKLIREELPQPITHTAACGGTHRLFGLAYAVRKREKRGEPIDGEYARARTYLDKYIRHTFKLQNSDGSFSTQWFKRRENSHDLDRRMQTTGHILEWLVFSLPEAELTDPRVMKAVDYLAGIMIDGRRRSWEPGPRGHALHALTIYDKRLFKKRERSETAQLARKEEIHRESPRNVPTAIQPVTTPPSRTEAQAPAGADADTSFDGPLLFAP